MSCMASFIFSFLLRAGDSNILWSVYLVPDLSLEVTPCEDSKMKMGWFVLLWQCYHVSLADANCIFQFLARSQHSSQKYLTSAILFFLCFCLSLFLFLPLQADILLCMQLITLRPACLSSALLTFPFSFPLPALLQSLTPTCALRWCVFGC